MLGLSSVSESVATDISSTREDDVEIKSYHCQNLIGALCDCDYLQLDPGSDRLVCGSRPRTEMKLEPI